MNIENKLYENICDFLLKNKNKINYDWSSFDCDDIITHYFIYKGKKIEVYQDKNTKVFINNITNYRLTIDNFWIKPTILLKSYENLCKYLNDKGNREIKKKKRIEEMNNGYDESFNNLLKKTMEEHYKRIDGNLGDNEDYECDYSRDVWLG